MKTFSPSALDIAVRAWVVAALGIPVDYADQRDRPRRTVAHATVKRIGGGAVGAPTRTYETNDPDDDLATERILRRRVSTYTVSIFGDGGLARAEALTDSPWRDDIEQINSANGIVVVGSVGGPLTVGIASASVPDNRTVVDFEIRHASINLRADVPTIDSVSATINGE